MAANDPAKIIFLVERHRDGYVAHAEVQHLVVRARRFKNLRARVAEEVIRVFGPIPVALLLGARRNPGRTSR